MKRLFLLFFAFQLAASALGAAPERPNILWLVAENISLDLGSYGEKRVRTPNLDRLAAEGLDVCLRPGMGHILFALFEKNDQVIRDLAARVQLSPSTMTGILKQMERMRLITRRRDGEDGRAVRVRLTDLAWSLEPRCARILDELNRILQSGLSAEEVQYVKEGLEKMVSNMRQGEEHSSEALEKQKNGVQMIEIVTAGRSKASPPVNLSDRRKVQ